MSAQTPDDMDWIDGGEVVEPEPVKKTPKKAEPEPPKHIETVSIHGKEHPTYAGVLAQAHPKLQGIQTELLQAPMEENRFMAIIKATVTDTKGRVFEGIGDATPKNVNAMIAPHIVRMAETRAKGRALRDMLNIAQALKEELLEGDTAPEATYYSKAQSKGSGRTYPCPVCHAPPGRMHASGCKYRRG